MDKTSNTKLNKIFQSVYALQRVVEERGVKVLELGCPYCDPPVHIQPGVPCPGCGAEIAIVAIRERPVTGAVKCVICGKPGGTMESCEGGYKHRPSCFVQDPGVYEAVNDSN